MQRSLKILVFFVLPCFALEAAYKIWWYSSGASQIPFLGNVYLSDAIACILELSSWLYRTSIFFLVCVLFRLICYLQILRLQDFAQVFQEESDVGSVLKEHLRIRRHLRVISHRYRAFILSALMIITASQFASLFSTTLSHDVSIFRAGELAVSLFFLPPIYFPICWIGTYYDGIYCL
ncbi:Extracellular ligand-gated ion channel protein [Thalictrum thalictroides]|uniref:Extracellular ligand-gated ion channel protein n=2 Tax=Thalictrum thalictroides TaxID=46969 RepID=A0A7J6VNC6_THATH|nr:Extracellular ligand-gated ion channel protein [Thalictrum thalictroides]